MATATSKSRCFICSKENATTKCSGCENEFCFNHLLEHRQELSKEFDYLENRRNNFQQTLTEQNPNPYDYSLLEEINQWEKNSIEKIQQTADDTRRMLTECINEKINEIEIEMNKLTEQLKNIRYENDFNEIDIIQFEQILDDLEDKFRRPLNFSVKKEESEFIERISLANLSSTIHTKWEQNGVTVAGGKGKGHAMNQLSSPYGVYVDRDETVYIADQNNHRVVAWERDSTGSRIVAGTNGEGNDNSQLCSPLHAIVDKQNSYLIVSDSKNRRVVRWSLRTGSTCGTIIPSIYCCGLAMDNDGYLYVTDLDRDEVRRYKIGELTLTSKVVAGGNGKGSRLDQLNSPSFIFVDQNQTVYVSDSCNHRVMKWIKGTKTGIVIAGGHGEGNALNQLVFPRGIFVDELGCIYVVDCRNNRIMRWAKGTQEGTVIIGGNERGSRTNQLNVPIGLYCDGDYNFYIVDSGNNRVQKFSRIK